MCTGEFKFSELSREAKDHAKEKAAEAFGYAWADEAIDSLKKLAEHFGGKLTHYAIDFFAGSQSTAEFDMPEDMTAAEIQRRLKQLGTYDPKTLKGHGDCKLTGYTADEDAIDGFRAAWFGGKVLGQPRDLDELMQAAFKTWLKAAQADAADAYTDETFGDNSEANDYRYCVHGDLV